MCGIIGISNRNKEVVCELYDGLIHLQHRGQDAAGIVTYGNHLYKKCGRGLVREVFKHQSIKKLTGKIGIGHVRYITSGNNNTEETQPLWINSPYGIAISHNGNIINQEELAQKLHKRCRYLNTQSDTEIILNFLADNLAKESSQFGNIFNKLCNAVTVLHEQLVGAYSIIGMIVNNGLFAFRDPNGIRPLSCGRREVSNGQYDYIFASEPTMFFSLGFEQIDSVGPGEVVYINNDGEMYRRTLCKKSFNPCVFEYIYFARPDSKLDDVCIYRARLRMGQNLARAWEDAFPDIFPDIVIPAPQTSNTAALSFAHYLGVRYSEGLYKNPFVGRTFIMPNNNERKRSIRYKLCPQETEIKGKKVLILDDSIVRGNTGKEIVAMMREYGASEVYFVTTCPPVKFPCFYGIDTPTRKELIAANMSIKEVQSFLGVDKLLYQSLDDLLEAVTRRGNHKIDRPCLACLNGEYPCDNMTFEMVSKLEEKRTQQRNGKKKHD